MPPEILIANFLWNDLSRVALKKKNVSAAKIKRGIGNNKRNKSMSWGGMQERQIKNMRKKPKL